VNSEATQQLEANGQQSSATAVGEEAEVADANEAAREQMQQETSQELIRGQAHQLLLVAVCGVTPTEADLVVVQRNQSMVGDRDAMRVCTEIAQNVFGSSERTLGVDHPVMTEQGSQPCCEALRISQIQEAVVEPE
jgi:hypothetical protein